MHLSSVTCPFRFGVSGKTLFHRSKPTDNCHSSTVILQIPKAQEWPSRSHLTTDGGRNSSSSACTFVIEHKITTEGTDPNNNEKMKALPKKPGVQPARPSHWFFPQENIHSQIMWPTFHKTILNVFPHSNFLVTSNQIQKYMKFRFPDSHVPSKWPDQTFSGNIELVNKSCDLLSEHHPTYVQGSWVSSFWVVFGYLHPRWPQIAFSGQTQDDCQVVWPISWLVHSNYMDDPWQFGWKLKKSLMSGSWANSWQPFWICLKGHWPIEDHRQTNNMTIMVTSTKKWAQDSPKCVFHKIQHGNKTMIFFPNAKIEDTCKTLLL